MVRLAATLRFALSGFGSVILRRYLAYGPGEVFWIYRPLGHAADWALVMVLHICFLRVLLKLVLSGLLMWLVG